MRGIGFVGLLAVVAAGCSDGQPSRPTPDGATRVPAPRAAAKVPAGSVGLWVVPPAQVEAAEARLNCKGGQVRVTVNPTPFYYDGETVTLHLLTLKAWMWRSEDDYYRVRAKWVGDALFYRPPFGGWEKLATFRGGHFVDSSERVVLRYERVPRSQVPEGLRPLVKAREKHDYSITPVGGRDPERPKDLGD